MTLATRTINGNNSGSYLRRPKIVVMHATRSGREWTDEEELEATLSWFVNPDGASAQWVLSEEERARVVADSLIAWHSAYLNGRSWGVELTQPTSDRPFRNGHYDNAALVGRHYVSLGVAPTWLPFWDGNLIESGFVDHQDTIQGRESGKTDIGPKFDRPRFIASLEDDMDEAEVRRIVDDQVKKTLFRARPTGGAATGAPGHPLETWLGSDNLPGLLNHVRDDAKHSAGEVHDHGIPANRTEKS